MRQTYKFALRKPNRAFVAWHATTCETHRRLYNEALSLRIHEYKEKGITLSCFSQCRWLTTVRKSRPFMKRVQRDSLERTLDRLDKAYKAFFRRVKSGGKPGFPRFKGQGEWNSITFVPGRDRKKKKHPREWVGKGVEIFPPAEGERYGRIIVAEYFDDGDLYHESKIVWHRDLPADAIIKQASIVNEGGKLFLCLSMVVADEAPSCGAGKVGVDLGLTEFAVTSNEERLGTTRTLEAVLPRLRALQKKLSRAKRGSNSRKRKKDAVRRLHARVRNIRKYQHQAVAKALVDSNVHIGIEDLTVKNMVKNRCHSRRISDAGWAAFRLVLTNTAARRGATVVAVDPRWTSQECSGCGDIVPKDLSVRIHDCPKCGLVIDRDVNAARNILARSLAPATKTRKGRAGPGVVKASLRKPPCELKDSPPEPPVNRQLTATEPDGAS